MFWAASLLRLTLKNLSLYPGRKNTLAAGTFLPNLLQLVFSSLKCCSTLITTRERINKKTPHPVWWLIFSKWKRRHFMQYLLQIKSILANRLFSKNGVVFVRTHWQHLPFSCNKIRAVMRTTSSQLHRVVIGYKMTAYLWNWMTQHWMKGICCLCPLRTLLLWLKFSACKCTGLIHVLFTCRPVVS